MPIRRETGYYLKVLFRRLCTGPRVKSHETHRLKSETKARVIWIFLRSLFFFFFSFISSSKKETFLQKEGLVRTKVRIVLLKFSKSLRLSFKEIFILHCVYLKNLYFSCVLHGWWSLERIKKGMLLDIIKLRKNLHLAKKGKRKEESFLFVVFLLSVFYVCIKYF